MHSLRIFVFVLIGVALTLQTSGGERKDIVAVFNIETKKLKIDRETVDALGDYLAARVAAEGKYNVIPRKQLRERMLGIKSKSHRQCYDQSCQIEIGKELAAQKIISSKILKLGNSCIVTLTLYDLRKAATEKGATVKGGCSDDDITRSIEEVVSELIRGKPAGQDEIPAPPPVKAVEAPVPKGTYKIIAAHSGKCPDVWWAKKYDLQKIIQHKCHFGDNQLFELAPDQQGYYSIRAKHSGSCLEISTLNVKDDGTNLVQTSCDGGSNQEFKLADRGGGYKAIINAASGKCLDVWSATKKDWEDIVQWQCHYQDNQVFLLEPKDQGYHAIKNKNSGLCLDVWWALNWEEQPVIQHDCHNGHNQQFKMVPGQSGSFKLQARHSGKCLEIPEHTPTSNLNRLHQRKCTTHENQKFQIVKHTEGKYLIKSKISDKCLDVWGGLKNDGEPIVQFDCRGTDNQAWRLEQIKR